MLEAIKSGEPRDVELSVKSRQRLTELYFQAFGAKAAADASVAAANSMASRYNDTLGSAIEAMGISPDDFDIGIDFITGVLKLTPKPETPKTDTQNTTPTAEVPKEPPPETP